VHDCYFFNWIHRSSQLCTPECGVVNRIWSRSSIPFKQVPLCCLFFGPHLTTHQSNTRVLFFRWITPTYLIPKHKKHTYYTLVYHNNVHIWCSFSQHWSLICRPFIVPLFNRTAIFWTVLCLGVDLRTDTEKASSCVWKRLDYVLRMNLLTLLGSIVHIIGGTYMSTHLMSSRILTLIMNIQFIGAPKLNEANGYGHDLELAIISH